MGSSRSPDVHSRRCEARSPLNGTAAGCSSVPRGRELTEHEIAYHAWPLGCVGDHPVPAFANRSTARDGPVAPSDVRLAFDRCSSRSSSTTRSGMDAGEDRDVESRDPRRRAR